MKIAFTGVFDLENYGEHVFPIIFKSECDKRSIDADIYLFSCFENKYVFGEEKNVYPMEELEAMHEQLHFDLVVIGGGEIIHYYKFEHQLNGDTVLYPMYKIWVIPSLVCYKHQIPVVWNNPGVPFEFEPLFSEITEQVLNYPSYLSVRNPFSVSCIEKYRTVNKVHCNPDTAFLLSQVYQEDELANLKKKVLDLDNYVIFHASYLMKPSEINRIIEILKKVSEQGYNIVLLPLAYTNKDDEFLKEFNEVAGNIFYTFKDKLTVPEIVSVFYGSKAYVGFSFHGVITAFSFGKPVVAYDYANNKKTKDLFDLIEQSEYYLNGSEKLYDSIMHAINNPADHTQTKLKIQKKLDEHFDEIFKIENNSVQSDPENNKNSNSEKVEINTWNTVSTFIGKSSDLLNQSKGNSFEFMLKEEEYRRKLEYMQNRIDELEKINTECKLRKLLTCIRERRKNK